MLDSSLSKDESVLQDCLWISVTRLGDLLDFNLLKSPTFLGNFCKAVKVFNIASEIILGNFYRHLVTFYWSHCSWFPVLYSNYFHSKDILAPIVLIVVLHYYYLEEEEEFLCHCFGLRNYSFHWSSSSSVCLSIYLHAEEEEEVGGGKCNE